MAKSRQTGEAEAAVEAGKAETGEQRAEQPVASAPDGAKQPTDAAKMRAGAESPVMQPPARAPLPGVGSTDGVKSSNPKTPFIEPAPELSVEDENAVLRAELERLRKLNVEDVSDKRPLQEGFPKLVTATEMVFYNQQRYREGDTFSIRHPEDFSKKGSMIWANTGTEQRQTSGTQSLKQLHDDLLGERRAAATGAENVLAQG